MDFYSVASSKPFTHGQICWDQILVNSKSLILKRNKLISHVKVSSAYKWVLRAEHAYEKIDIKNILWQKRFISSRNKIVTVTTWSKVV